MWVAIPDSVVGLVHPPGRLSAAVVHRGPDWPNEKDRQQEDLEEPRDKDREPEDVIEDGTAVLGYLASSC